MEVHSLTNIHPNAKIGERTVVEAFTTIQEDVVIGEDNWIGPNVTIMNGARIGNRCKIFPGAVVSGEPQDLKFSGEITETFVGDDTTIRECVTISRGTTDRLKTVVGSKVLLMAYVHVAHDCVIGDHCILANSVQVAGHVEVSEHAIIGGTTAIHQFVKIGQHAIISGGSLVRKDVPPFVKAAREPLSYSGINVVGLKRKGFEQEQINRIQDVYRFLYLRGFNNSKAIDSIEGKLPPSQERDDILFFIKNSERGLMKGHS